MTASVDRPAAPIDLHAEAEVRAAARALMRTPMLYDGGGHDDELRLVRRHRAELGRVFADGLGYRLVVEPGVARLFKTGLGPDTTRGLRRRNGMPFTPRRYALLALVLAALSRGRAQVMVDELVADVRSAAVDAGIDVDLDALSDRRALHSAIVALCDLGVLTEREGDLEHWAERRSESLLDIHRDRLDLLLATPLAGCAGPDDVLSVASVPSAAGGARVAVRRRLAELPVMTTDDLPGEHRDWWSRNRNREREWFRRALGLEVELRAEGAIAIDPDGELTDVAFPGGGSARHFALLLLEAAVTHLRGAHGGPPVGLAVGAAWASLPESAVRRLGEEVFAGWREGFRKAHREDPDGLYAEALQILEAAGLVRREQSMVHVHAASARFAPRPALVESSASGERSLFDQEDP